MTEPNTEPARLAQLADRLDCLTEGDLSLVTGNAPATIEYWRKAGEGPSYIRAGKRVLYPRAAVADWLQTKLRIRSEGRTAASCL